MSAADPDHAVAIVVMRLRHADGPAAAGLRRPREPPGSICSRRSVPDDRRCILPPVAARWCRPASCPNCRQGYEGQVRPRSGLALKHGITVLNAPGTIDSDYRGEVKVILINLGAEAFAVTRGMRIAQMVIAPVTRADDRRSRDASATRRAARAASARPGS